MNTLNISRLAMIALSALFLHGCEVEIIDPDKPVVLEYNFAQGQQNWQAGFAEGYRKRESN